MCRTGLGAGHLVHLQKEDGVQRPEPAEPKKRTKLLEILKEKPKGRFLVFSNHDNPFDDFGTDCDDARISYRILKGNAQVIAKAVEDFEKGKLQVLFLNSRELGVGMNLVSATDVILYHALTPEEEKQVVGRALRMGRVHLFMSINSNMPAKCVNGTKLLTLRVKRSRYPRNNPSITIPTVQHYRDCFFYYQE